MTTRELNSLGTVNHYGKRDTNDGLPAGVATYGVEKQIQMSFDFTQLNLGKIIGTSDAANLVIPANSVITDAWLEVIVAFASGTDITIGLDKWNNTTAIDANGIFTSTAGAVAKLVVNAWIKGDGDLAVPGSAGDNVGIGVDNAVITIDANGTFTTGEARLILKYIEPSKRNN